jgi:hypothetical protein
MSDQGSVISATAMNAATSSLIAPVHKARDIVLAACANIELLLSLPTKRAALDPIVRSLDTYGLSSTADKVERLTDLETKVFGGSGDDNLSAGGDIAALMEAEKRLAFTYNDVVSTLQMHTGARDELIAGKYMPSASCERLTATLRDLSGIFSKRSVERKSPSKHRALSASQAKTNMGQRDITLLTDELSRKRRIQERQQMELQGTLNVVLREYDTLYKAATDHQTKVRTNKETMVSELTTTHNASTTELRANLAKLNEEYALLMKKHVDEHESVSNRTGRAQVDMEGAIQEYDAEVGSRRGIIDNLMEESKVDGKVIGGFEGYYAKVRTHVHT